MANVAYVSVLPSPVSRSGTAGAYSLQKEIGMASNPPRIIWRRSALDILSWKSGLLAVMIAVAKRKFDGAAGAWQ